MLFARYEEYVPNSYASKQALKFIWRLPLERALRSGDNSFWTISFGLSTARSTVTRNFMRAAHRTNSPREFRLTMKRAVVLLSGG